MGASKTDSTQALVAVVKALEPLNDDDRRWVLQSAASRWNASQLQITGGTGSFAAPPGAAALSISNGNSAVEVQQILAKKDVRAFIRLKKPTTDVQRVACLVYYLTQVEGSAGFSSKAIAQAHTESGGSAINMPRALDNATRGSKYLSNRGPREKQLTTLGEDVVLALPDQQAVKSAESAGKRRTKSRAKKKAKKKD